MFLCLLVLRLGMVRDMSPQHWISLFPTMTGTCAAASIAVLYKILISTEISVAGCKNLSKNIFMRIWDPKDIDLGEKIHDSFCFNYFWTSICLYEKCAEVGICMYEVPENTPACSWLIWLLAKVRYLRASSPVKVPGWSSWMVLAARWSSSRLPSRPNWCWPTSLRLLHTVQ